MSKKTARREDFKRLVTFILSGILLAIQTSIFGYVWYEYYLPKMFVPFWRRGNWVFIGVYGLVCLIVGRLFGSLKVWYLKKAEIVYTFVLASTVINIFAFIQITMVNRYFLPWSPLLQVAASQCLFCSIWCFIARKIYKKLYPAKNLLMIYGDYDPRDMMAKMNRRSDKYHVSDRVSVQIGREAVCRKMDGYDGVIIWDLPSETRNWYIKYCFEHSIRCYVSPKISDIILEGSDRIRLLDTPLLLARNHGLAIDQRFIKRVMDIVFSLLFIILLSPLMAVIALIIRLYDGGPVLYRQSRLTRDAQEFDILKFRSMTVDAEKRGVRLAGKNDDRVTPPGQFLRRTHLDELPQLFNVFMGQMSLVGPRPERGEIHRVYEKEIPEFGYRLKVKGGLTGYAQVYGKYNTTPYDKLKLDLYYIENYSLLLDIRLLFMTARIFFMREASEGVEEGQKFALKNTKGALRGENRKKPAGKRRVPSGGREK